MQSIFATISPNAQKSPNAYPIRATAFIIKIDKGVDKYIELRAKPDARLEQHLVAVLATP